MPYKQFTLDQRNDLQMMHSVGVDVKDIAKCLDRHRSTIYRELKRNSTKNGKYICYKAQENAIQTRQNAKTPIKTTNPKIIKIVLDKLKQDHSPEQIAGRLKIDYPNDKSMHISHESIYKLIYSRLEDFPELKDHLRHGRKKRKKRTNSRDNRGIIPNRKFIDERPPIVDKKTRFGDWEGDTIEGSNKKNYILTFVERKSKTLIARKITRKTAEEVYYGTCEAFRDIDIKLIKTITVDNGKEFSMHQSIAKSIDTDIYFAHPYHSWERGLNEHTNGLLRQYFPKGYDFTRITQKKLDKIVLKINNRPRKSLNYRTPNEVFLAKLVALQT